MEQDKVIESSPAATWVAEGVWMLTDIFVNLYFIQDQASREWVLVDTGLVTSASKIKKAATALFGEGNPPAAIVLTHGHFDHSGSVKSLAEAWEVPVYAHPMEMPYLTGRSSYPPADPAVGGGAIAWLSGLYPLTPIDLADRVQKLPADGKVPVLDDWKWLYTPGHAPGHVSLFREVDHLLVAGDALATTKSESAFATMLEQKKLSGPPAFVVYDWKAAGESVKKLSDLQPATIVSGHGPVLREQGVQDKLERLAMDFDIFTAPKHTRYAEKPAVVDEDGVVSVPPVIEEANATLMTVIGLVVGVALGWTLFSRLK